MDGDGAGQELADQAGAGQGGEELDSERHELDIERHELVM